MSGGILKAMMSNNSITYNPGKLTIKDIETAIGRIPPRPQQFIIYAGSTGKQVLEFTIAINQVFPNLKTWLYIPKRVPNIIYVSLFQKHGLFKIKLYTDGRRLKYELMQGTTSIGKSNSIECIRTFIRLNEKQK